MYATYIGNGSSMKVHTKDCEFAVQIHPDNFEVFEELYHALSLEYEECKWCIGEERLKDYKRKVAENFKLNASSASCVCCGETRGVQRAHILARRHGGAETMPLCPNCHWNYDHGTLTHGESQAVDAYLRKRRRELTSSGKS